MKTALSQCAILALLSFSFFSLAEHAKQPSTQLHAVTARNTLRVTDNYIPLRKHVAPHIPGQGSTLRRRGIMANLTNIHDVYYIIELQVGNQTIPVSVDTGSSDTWLVQNGYRCISYYGETPDCGLGEGLRGNLSGGNIPDLVFGRAYTDGTFVRGYFGYDDVSIGGITAKHQQLGLVDVASWFGDGLVSGLLGLAYPLMTSLEGGEQSMAPYNPVFFTMWKDKLVQGLFSIALSRDADQLTPPGNEAHPSSPVESAGTSFLALGGLPPVTVDEESWAITPIQSMKLLGDWDFSTEERGLYIIVADAWVYGRRNGSVGLSKNTTQFPVLIDVGATLSVLPKELVMALYESFDPPAKYMSSRGLFYALCNATVPEFGVQIGTSIFYFAPEDLLRQNARDPTNEYCRIGVTDSYFGPYVLGVTFLSNVVAVFDVGNNEMRFASRKKY
ncbi:aspartic peptidase domain-containing protein [Bombardia bombarda]|uniref:Aspartic peptidase domain-containing protein n=1 Tax=Bombardia bombarda TaxID=252184 RepID=A0AA39X8U7_9PEZI|nr:aspartic peptidase domain-containing protein [Bombardia bombarda]